MKKIGSFMAVIGIAAVVFGLMDRVPKILFWIYNWGETVAWAIKIGLIVIGGALFFMGKSPEDEQTEE